MLTRAQLNDAVERNIINAAQRDALVDLAISTPAGLHQTFDDEAAMVAGKDENIRLIGGGNDLFVTIGVVLLSVGLFFVFKSIIGEQAMFLYSALAVFFWFIAEFVTRQHRMRLASTVIGLGFVLCVMEIAIAWLIGPFGLEIPDNAVQAFALRGKATGATLLFFGSLLAAAVLYFWRFRVPIMAGVIAVSFTLLAFSLGSLFLYDGVTAGSVQLPQLEDLPELLRDALYIPLIAGLIVFYCGVLLDLKDRDRVTVWSDCAFWLHVVSAPLLVHPLFIMSTGMTTGLGAIEPENFAGIMLGVLIVSFLYVALAIDRRSLLIPTLAYFGALGISQLVSSIESTTTIPPFATILLVIGTLVIVFGAGWQRIRNLIVRPTLPTSWLNKLPPIKV